MLNNFRYENPNPDGKNVGDCTVRAIAIATDQSWDKTYWDLCIQGFIISDMPSSNDTWGSYLTDHGWRYHRLQDTCPFCYTVKDFCADHPDGYFIVGTGTHVICVIDGQYHDAWDSGEKVPLYYFEKER